MEKRVSQGLYKAHFGVLKSAQKKIEIICYLKASLKKMKKW